MPTTSLMPEPRQRYFNNNGTVAAGCLLYTYAAGTSTPKATYTDSAGTTPHANPIVLDSKGEAVIYWSGNYKIDLKTAAGVQITGYPVDNYAYSATAADTLRADLAASSGAGLVGWIRNAIGAVATTLAKWMGWQPASVFDFMTDAQIADVQAGTALLDLSTPLQAARDWIAVNATRRKLVFPSGIYAYSVSPNWAINDAEIRSQGEVRLRYTGTGEAVIIDAGGASSNNIYNMEMGYFIVEAPATALDGVFVRGIHHSHLGFNVRGAGVASAGILVKFAVVTEFDRPTVSVNENGWYLGAKPAIGISLAIRNAGETVSYCSFHNPIAEGPPIGIQLAGTLGNSFFSGTSEGCATYGVFAASSSINDKFYGTDFEANTGADVYCQGTGLTLNAVESTNLIAFGTTAKRCTITGGEHGSVLFDAGSTGCIADKLKYNRLNNGATFVDAGTDSVIASVKNAQTNKSYLTNEVAYAGVVGIAASGTTSTNVAVSGAKLTDTVVASINPMTAGFLIYAYVSSAGVVTVLFSNQTGGVATLAAGTLSVKILRI